MKNIFRDRQLSIKLKARLLKCFAWPVHMYGCETWTVATKTRKNYKICIVEVILVKSSINKK